MPYIPLDHFQATDDDHSTVRIRDMPYGKRRESLVIYPTSLSFPLTAIGTSSPPYPVMITNNGYDIAVISEIKIVGDFTLNVSDIPNNTIINPGEYISLSIVFTPKRPGISTGGVYIDSGDAAGLEFITLSGSGSGSDIDPDNTVYMPITGDTFTGRIGMDLGTIEENLPDHPNNPTRGYLPFAPVEGAISIHGTQLRMWADMTGGGNPDGDYDADLASKSNMYLVAGGGIQLIPSTNGFLPWNEDGTIQSGGTLGRIRVAADEIANYIQSGGNYSGSWYKDLILTRYNVASPWMIFDESKSGNCGIGYLFPKSEEPAANGDLYETWTVNYRLHVIDSDVDVAMIESTGASARLHFKDPGTTKEISIGSNGNELVFRTDDLNRLRIGSTSTYPAVHNYHSSGKTDFRWAAGWFRDIHPGLGTALWTSGTGTPEGVVTATVGSLYTRADGGAGTTLYVKESGTGNTGWVAK